MQFQNDWPGLFLRGDTAIREVHRDPQPAPAGTDDDNVSSALRGLSVIADLIDRDVHVK